MIFQCNIQIFQAFVFLCISTMFACSIVQEFFTIWWKPFVCQVSVCASKRGGQKVVPLIICPLTSLSPHNFCPHTPAHIDSKAIAIDLINYVVLVFSLQMMKEKVRSKLTVNSANIRSEVFTEDSSGCVLSQAFVVGLSENLNTFGAAVPLLAQISVKSSSQS